VLAHHGYGSRRALEELITAGRILVDGEPAVLGRRVGGTERIEIDGQRVAITLRPGAAARVIAYHKPSGEIVSRSDPEGRASVFDRLPNLRFGRWIAVGRLDVTTSGLLLFTDDGELAEMLMHPRSRLERHYAVRVIGEGDDRALSRLREGVELDDGPARFERIESGGGEGANRWYVCVLREGRNREVRRMFDAVNLSVSRLIRTRYGSYELPRDLPRGRWRELAPAEVEALRAGGGQEDDA